MPRKGHTEEEILRALREVEAGETGTAVCRKLGISEQTLYVWKKKYAGVGLSELRQRLVHGHARAAVLRAQLMFERNAMAGRPGAGENARTDIGQDAAVQRRGRRWRRCWRAHDLATTPLAARLAACLAALDFIMSIH